jgi:hypothetical protein
VYRFLREHDLAPYIYATEDYGKTWTKLTSGANGIPGDHPTRVVREDTTVPGLLYAGTEFAAFVSFDNGKHWQSLQQNLPATPVTDIRVHRNDLVIATMGRSFWIMDDVSPLHQIAGGLRRGAATAARANGEAPAPIARQADGFSADATVFLFQPRPAFRMRYTPAPAAAPGPEYPPPSAGIDYYLANEPAGEVKLEVLDDAGKVIRTVSSEAAAPRAGASQEMRGGRFGAPASRLSKRPGMNRFSWDLRHADTPDSPTPGPGPGGPLVVPGRYQVRLTAAGTTFTRTLDVQMDPRVTAAGVTRADLREQTDLLLKLRDTTAEARQLQARITKAMESQGIKPAPAPGPGETPATVKYSHPLQALYSRLVSAPGPYPQPMLLEQLSNVARMLRQADQKPGKDAWDRYNDLVKELASIEAEAKKVLSRAAAA